MSTPSPADVVGVLSKGFQDLYNAAWGRGVLPLVEPSLANAIADAWEQWRAERAGAALAPIRVERYRQLFEALRARMAKAGKPIAPLYDLGSALGGFTKEVVKGAAVAGILYLIAKWANRGNGE